MHPFPIQQKMRSVLSGEKLILALVLMSTVYGTDALAKPTTHTIVIEAMKFTPESLTVRPGDTVIWVNKDAFPHNATASNRGFRSPDIAPDGSWKFKATKKGTFAYICTLHPTMKANIVVK
jgi:plastocyanin